MAKFHFAVRFHESRPAKWKALHSDWQPTETRIGEDVAWLWAGEHPNAVKAEPNTPPWHISFPSVQISDCADWKEVSAAVFRAWEPQSHGAAIAELAEQIKSKDATISGQLDRALRLIENEFRYLSVNWELGGNIPTPPDVVARRRYGDCKDLSFLLVHLLTALGITARPVLVNTHLRGSVKAMLPTPRLFNHVVVEFELAGQRRWVDLTNKLQGGGAMSRVVPDFGVGLGIEPALGTLVEPPRVSVHSGVYEVTETLLLDTTGAPSVLAVMVTATGCHAEWFRAHFETADIDDIARERLQTCANRYGNAQRLGTMDYRDDREANQFLLAEVFEVNGFLQASDQPGFCKVLLPPNLALSILPAPDKGERRTPFALPYPCHVIHHIQMESSTMQLSSFKRAGVESPFVSFSRNHKHIYRHWAATFEFSTAVDAVPPERIDEYRDTLDAIWRDSMIAFMVPVGYAHPRKRDDFGKFPLPPLEPEESSAVDQQRFSANRRNTISPNVTSTDSAVPMHSQLAERPSQLMPGRDAVGPLVATPAENDSRLRSRKPRRRKKSFLRRIPLSFWLVAPIALFCAFLIFLAIRMKIAD